MIGTLAQEAIALLAGIKAEPDSDARRFIYADFLEEYGDDPQHAHAAFIRAQVRQAAFGQVECRNPRHRHGMAAPNPLMPCGRCPFCRDEIAAYDVYRMRCADVETQLGLASVTRGVTCMHHSLHEEPSREHLTLYLWRGFVEAIRGPVALVERHGRAIGRHNPLTLVHATDKEPEQVGGEWWWYDEEGQPDGIGACDLPTHLFLRLADSRNGCGWKGPNRQWCVSALDDLLLEYCREEEL